MHLNPGEETLQHETGAEGLRTPALNPCGVHRGARVQLWDKRGGQRQRQSKSNGSDWHANPRPRPRTLGLGRGHTKQYRAAWR
jgi:hypothetical protein